MSPKNKIYAPHHRLELSEMQCLLTRKIHCAIGKFANQLSYICIYIHLLPDIGSCTLSYPNSYPRLLFLMFQSVLFHDHYMLPVSWVLCMCSNKNGLHCAVAWEIAFMALIFNPNTPFFIISHIVLRDLSNERMMYSICSAHTTSSLNIWIRR